ncbi:MAG TPA: PH domain-containing protein [Thermoanaerobaculia bacterium]|nr:PH domain-containing protein [Thermoanaerobaculia bacterium]
MSIRGQLQQGEEILYRAHPSRIVLLPPLFAAAIAGILGLWILNAGGSTAAAAAAGVVALAALAVALVRELMLRTRDYVLTDRRLLRQTGVLGKVSMDSYLDKINNVEHRQDLWGRLFSYGDLEIDTASESGAEVFHRISRPLAFKRAIDAAVYTFHHPAAAAAPAAPAAASASASLSTAERMRQLKKLLDDGLISQPEFEAKRKQILEQI